MATNNTFFASSNQIYSFDPFAQGFTFETWANFQSFGNASCSNLNATIPSLFTLRGDLPDAVSVAYPPATLGSSTVVSGNQYSLVLSGQTYGNGTYITNSSSLFATGTLAAHLAFDKTLGSSANIWQSSAAGYSTTTGLYTGAVYYTIVNGTVIAGEWIEITLPQQTLLTSYSLSCRTDITTQMPYNWILAATNDGGKTWNQIDYENTIAFVTSEVKSFSILNNTVEYNQYRIIVTAVPPSNSNGSVSVAEWILNGTPMNLLAYPPASLGSSTLVSGNKYTVTLTGQTYGNGTYVTNSSTFFTANQAYLAFDKITNGATANIWATSTASYNTTTGLYIGSTYNTNVQGTTINGEWLEITLPSQIVLTSYSLTCRSNTNVQMPYVWYIVASNDNGTNWFQIDVEYNWTYVSGQVRLFTIVNNSVAYNQYRIIITAIPPAISDGYASINEWILNAGNSPIINSLYSFGVSTEGRLCSYWNNNGPFSALGNTRLSLNNWYHIAVAAAPAGGTLRMFINGALESSAIIPSSLSSNALGNYLLIGQLGNSCYTNAYLSNLRLIYGAAVYNSAAGFYLTNTPLTPYPTGMGIGECILLLRAPGTVNNTVMTLNNSGLAGNNYVPATGGTITYYSVDGVTYAVHSFTATGASTFVLNESRVCDILIVAAGGGGGGAGGGGGGGGGGFQYFAGVSLANGSYSVTVGTGGTAGSGGSAPLYGGGGSGGNSIFGSLPPSIGGGGAASNNGNSVALSGGSGGGAGYTITAGNGTAGQGYNGASAVFENANAYGAGGGGGAGGPGILGNNTNPGNGGPGLACSITGTLVYYAGGGAGGLYTSSPIAYGGIGGGGSSGTNGVPNTGGGGGGSIGTGASQAQTAAAGGSGIVIVRYVLNQFSITNTVAPPPCQFDGLSQAALSYGKGFYSLRRLLTSYTGPVVCLTRSSDSTRLDFYSDAYGNLGTYSAGAWISVSSWLGTSTGTVFYWYDQSGNGKPLGTPSTGTAPTISLGTENRLFFTGSTNSLQSVPGLLATNTGTGTQYTYFAIWNKTDTSAASLVEHNASSVTNNNRSAIYIANGTQYGFAGEANDNTTFATYANTNRVNSIFRINNALTTNLYIKSNSTDYSAASSNNTTLSLNNTGFTVGRKYSAGTEYFNGFITAVAVFGNYIRDNDANYLATL